MRKVFIARSPLSEEWCSQVRRQLESLNVAVEVLPELPRAVESGAVYVAALPPEEVDFILLQSVYRLSASGDKVTILVLLDANSHKSAKALVRAVGGVPCTTSTALETLSRRDPVSGLDNASPRGVTVAPLSVRERAVITLLLQGLSLKAVGHTLGLSITTISTYKRRALAKLGYTNNAELYMHHLEIENLLS